MYLEKMKSISLGPKEFKEVVYKSDHCKFEWTSKNDVSVHMEEVHRKDYTETEMETNHDNKLNGVGPIDDRPSTDKLHQFVKENKTKKKNKRE